MEDKEKILFTYPTLMTEDMTHQRPYPPTPALIDVSSTLKHTVIVTAGISLRSYNNTYISVDVFKNGEAVTIDSDELDGFQEIVDQQNFESGIIIVTTSMHVKNVIFSEPGQYEIITKLIDIDEENKKTQVDTFSCFVSVLTLKEN